VDGVKRLDLINFVGLMNLLANEIPGIISYSKRVVLHGVGYSTFLLAKISDHTNIT
jgi:hypothetical protein